MLVGENLNPDAVSEATSWEELQRLLEARFCGSRWVFRGQRDASWPLATNLERVCARVDRNRWAAAERHLISQFQRRLHQHSTVLPEPDDNLEWLALMQHHGAPTRLLDWTKSPFVAVYFAVEAAAENTPCSVWIVNRQAMHNEVLEGVDSVLVAMQAANTDRISHKSVFNACVTNGETPGVISVEPYRMNERLTVQQGLFLVPIDIRQSFLANLKGGPLPEATPTPNLSRIDLRLSYRGRLNVLEELRKMNIHRASLFPGIDGFAQSLATEIEIWGGFDTARIMVDGNYNELF